MFFIADAHVFSLLWQLKFSIDNGKSESRPLFLPDYRYFDRSFTVMSLEHMNLVQTAAFD